MKAIWQVLFTSLAVFLTVQLSAQSVTIQVALTPPYSPNFSDYENQLLMTLTNTTAQTVQIKLTGEIMNQDNSRYVRTSPQYQPAQPIVLQPNEVKTLFGNQDKTGFLDKNNVETNYTEIDKANILLSGLIPEGMYDVCINALDFTTGAPLSQPACQIIAIGYPAPPIPILPSCNSEVRDLLPVFNWLPPVGNFPNASLVYDMYLVKVPDGEDPNQVMLFAINGNNIQDLWEIPNITTTNYTYQPSDAPLVNDQNYVWAVRVHDQNNSVSFQNGGLSQICTFKWIDPANKLPDLPIACQNDCAVDVDLNSVAYHPSVNPNDFVKIGDFSMKIITFTVDQTKPYDQFSGMGMIDVPFLNSKKFRLRVKFTDIVLSTDMHVLAGKARGIRSSGFSVLPDFNDPTWTGQTLAQTTLTTIDDYLKNVWANGGDAIETINNTIGWEMPFGGTIKGHTLAATDIEFYPNHATLDAIAIVPLPQYSASMPVTRLGLGIGGLCLNSQTFCKEGKIHLFQDFGVDLDPQNPGDELVLKSATPDNSTKPADKAGTYILFDATGIKSVQIDARYNFPKDQIVRADGGIAPAQAHLKVETTGVLDWLLTGSMDAFKLKNNNDFTFYANDFTIDLSNDKNPDVPNNPNIPDITFFEMNSSTEWKGLYAKTLKVSFGHGLTGNPTDIIVKDLIIDEYGVSAKIGATDVIDINKGKIGTFNFTLDELNVEIFRNSIIKGNLKGQMLVNVAARDFYSTVRERVLNETKLQVVGNQIKLYEIRFRTSNYGDFIQKMDATTTNQVVYKVKKPIGNSRVSVTVDEAKLANNTAIITAINTALGKPASYKPTISYAEQILQRGGERFDLYDLKPYVKTVAGKTIFRSPKVVYNTADAKAFHLKMTNKLVKILQLTGKAYKDLEVESDMSLGFVSQVSGSPTILLAAEEGLTQNVPSHLPSFAGPNDFLFSENANTTAGSMTNGRHVIDFKSNWLGLDESDGNGNPHIYTGNFMNGNGYQPQSAQDFENIGAAMDAVDEEINALQINNTSVKPTVQSAAAPKAATGATGATGGGK